MDRDPYAAPDSGPPLAAAVMPGFTPLLLRATLATLGGLVVGCLLVALLAIGYLALTSPSHLPTMGEKAGEVLGIALFATMFGGLPALMVGAPGYALLVRWGWANGSSAAVLGAAPGLVLLAFSARGSMLLGIFGIVVALVTHALFQRGTRSRKEAA